MKRIWPRNAWGAPRFLPVITRRRSRRYHAVIAHAFADGWSQGLALLKERVDVMPEAHKAEMARARIALAEATRRLMVVSNDFRTSEPGRSELSEAARHAANAHLIVVRWILEREVDNPPDEG